MYSGVTEKGECEQEKDSADNLVPNDPRGPHHFGNNRSREGLGVVGLNGADKLNCVNELHHGFMLTGA